MAEYKQPIVVPNADIYYSQDPNKLKAQDLTHGTGAQRVSAGDPGSKAMNRNGEVTIRGCGAATKGTKARGPMA
jgi:urease alpha subunit